MSIRRRVLLSIGVTIGVTLTLVVALAPPATAIPPTLVTAFGSSGSGNSQFNQPLGMATDSSGNLYVADRANDRIEVLTPAGTFLRAMGSSGTGDGQLDLPSDVAIGPNGDVYVVDKGNIRIVVFDANGTFLRAWGSAGSGDGQFAWANTPDGVAAADDGTIYVSDYGNGRVEKFSATGAYQGQWNSPAPGAIGFDHQGAVYVVDLDGTHVHKYTAGGKLLLSFGNFGFDDGQQNLITDLAVGADDTLYLADAQSHQNPASRESRIEQFSTSGAYAGKFDVRPDSVGPNGEGRPAGLGTDCAGNLYMSDEKNHIRKYHQAGASCGLVVTDTGDTHDSTPGDKTCADSNGKCTLRAAIEEANAEAPSSPLSITFNIPGGGVPTITPGAALPAVTAAVALDASGQPGTGRERVVLGSTTRLGFAGLRLQGKASSVKGLTITGFTGAGLTLEGAGGDKVTQSVLTGNDLGIDVNAPQTTLDDIAVAANGDPAGATAFEQSVKGTNLSPADAQSQLLALGGGIVVRSAGDGLTLRGSVIGGLHPNDEGTTPSAVNQPIGVLLAPSTDALTGVTIGDSSSQNYFRGNGLGAVAAAPNAAVDALTIAGNRFGAEPDGATPIAPQSNGVGVLLSGRVSGARIGRAGAQNTFVDSAVAMMALGTGVTKLRVQFNQVGTDSGLGALITSLQGKRPVLGQHNLFGLVLGDVAGATVGGPTGSQNLFLGDVIGVLMSGTKSRLNSIIGNTFGRLANVPGKLNDRKAGDYGSLEAIVASQGGANKIGDDGLGNRIKDALVGVFVAGEDSDIISGNSVAANLYGLILNDVEKTSVGNASAASANVFTDNWIGTLQGHRELTAAEQRATKLDHSPADPSDRSTAFTTTIATNPLSLADALTSAEVDGRVVTIEDQNAAQNALSARYGRNIVGKPGHGNYIGMMFAGDVRRTIVGVGGGGPNVIEHNHAAGVALIGSGGHAPQGVSLIGNAIYDNATSADSLFPGAHGLGIDLINESGGTLPFGPTPNDPGDADTGPNGLQNYPVLANVSQSSKGQLSFAMTLESTPNTRFSVEIYSSPTCSPTGYGEGLHLLNVAPLSTGGSGAGAGAVEPALHVGSLGGSSRVPRGDRYLSATATAPDGSTSEFSRCVRIGTSPAPLTALPADTGVSNTGITSVEVFNAGAYDVREVRLDIQGFVSKLAGYSAHVGTHTIAIRQVHIRPHRAGEVQLKLTPAARRLLNRTRSLTVTATVLSTKGTKRYATTVRYVIYAPKRT